MNNIKILLVEDNDQDIKTCQDSAERYADEKRREITLITCKSPKEAFTLLNGVDVFDGAIVDIKLAEAGNEGNELGKQLAAAFIRVPTIILTGTPGSADKSHGPVGIYKKGETSYEALFDLIWQIRATGLGGIMGGRGLLEKTISDVFRYSILPNITPWTKYGSIDRVACERGLLRHIVSHILDTLDDDSSPYYPEEAYITARSSQIRTGSILKERSTSSLFIVLTPACDLVIRSGGKPKTDHVLVAEIDGQSIKESLLQSTESRHSKQLGRFSSCKHHHLESECYKNTIELHKAELEGLKNRLHGNAFSNYYHFLPAIATLPGGFVNFRKLRTIKLSKEIASYELTHQLAPSFVKDVISRFSSYYARQGQPDFSIA